MGYYIDLTDAEWEISESPEALATIREMPVKYHAIKRGGSSNGEKWFSWMNDTEIETTDTVENVFNQLGFETDKVDGGFKLTAYNSKTGQEDLFLAVMAPFTKDGSYIEWRGEDGELWKFEIHGGRMFRTESEIVWTNSQPYTYWHYDLEPGTMTGRTLNIDPHAPADILAEQLKTAKEWDDADRAYYEKLRAEREENKVEA
ncbi:MAG: hypothetical protein ACO3CD_04935 [Candidatus Nanopelagicaceae bacterium]